MKYTYILKMALQSKIDIDSINTILNIPATKSTDTTWELKLNEYEMDQHIYFIDYFLDLLQSKYSALENIGIHRDNISIWMIYEYNNQCNMEFTAKEMKRLGDNGVALCISCWHEG